MADFEFGVRLDDQRLFSHEFSVRVERKEMAALADKMQVFLADPDCIGFEIDMQNFALTIKPSIFTRNLPEF